MGSFYENIRDNTAGKLIKKYGMALTLRKITKGAYAAETGTRQPDSYMDYPCFGVIEEYKAYMVANSLVMRGDKKLILSANGLSVIPEIGDQIIAPDGIWFIPDGDGSQVSKFNPIETLAPGGITIMYTIQVRK